MQMRPNLLMKIQNLDCSLFLNQLLQNLVLTVYFLLALKSLFGSIEAAKSGLQVKLMQEGRMRVRGQAFLTFPSTDLAHHALNLVNGYVFQGKHIIQFGRNPAAAKGT